MTYVFGSSFSLLPSNMRSQKSHGQTEYDNPNIYQSNLANYCQLTARIFHDSLEISSVHGLSSREMGWIRFLSHLASLLSTRLSPKFVNQHFGTRQARSPWINWQLCHVLQLSSVIYHSNFEHLPGMSQLNDLWSLSVKETVSALSIPCRSSAKCLLGERFPKPLCNFAAFRILYTPISNDFLLSQYLWSQFHPCRLFTKERWTKSTWDLLFGLLQQCSHTGLLSFKVIPDGPTTKPISCPF